MLKEIKNQKKSVLLCLLRPRQHRFLYNLPQYRAVDIKKYIPFQKYLNILLDNYLNEKCTQQTGQTHHKILKMAAARTIAACSITTSTH